MYVIIHTSLNTHMREIILVEGRIAMSLQRLGIGNTLCIIREVYEVVGSTNLEIVIFFVDR